MKRLVLLGGGHAHVYVLDRLARERLADTEVVLVSPYARQVYSGMLPGWIAGRYALRDCVLPLDALADRAGVQRVEQACVALDVDARELRLADGSRLGFDLLSIDAGPATDIAALPGAAEHALPVRPIETFIAAIDGWLDAYGRGEAGDLAIVGGGAAGVELAFALDARLRALGLRGAAGSGPALRVIGGAVRPLAGLPRVLQWRAAALLRARGIEWLGGRRVEAVGAGFVRLDDGRELPARHTLLVTGAAAHPWLAASGLAVDEGGFVRVSRSLRSLSHPAVFAAGDCAAYADARPKSGVYAVRAGPPLAENLLRALRGEALEDWTPQRRALYLINTADGSALAAWGALAWWGGWVWRWKDRIDRAFMARFTPDGDPPSV
ncbi:FAD-dependent oxidoreductase [Thauera sp. CAU 1555]|uniref:FAD-dependent oxidoreductase n=1 Tax=Thauera sedimentorum TaxID=2767595 RepID=A0ABR9B825_9RHOO|nr:FAD-dependent oxidoreductase [Thauera sedimentorum]MBC9071259.1 FAD-dependent oxidoreductase [Thauera sedimentorum]MBD8502178.1 FAD-dependent oxidoreductase [Thauera sedimentorum]